MASADIQIQESNSVNDGAAGTTNTSPKAVEKSLQAGNTAKSSDKEIGNAVKKEKFPCPLCTKEFQNKSGRYNHIKLHHKVKLDFGKVHCLEAGCLFSCTYTSVLQQHLTNVHKIPMKYLNLDFDSYEAFEKWKHTFETREVCRFVKKSGARVDHAGKSMYLYCSRSGTFVSHGKGSRFKKIGTAKISAHCTALIKYFEQSDGKVKATVCTTHYGHNKDHRFLRLTKDQKLDIARKMQSGMSRDQVLDSLRSTFVNRLDRIHELSRRDLHNIQKTFNIPRAFERRRVLPSTPLNPLELISEDWTAEVDTRVDSPILFYKDAGSEERRSLTAKDKCLILMTRGQRDLFVKFCNNGVLYVTILRLSASVPLHLTVLFVLDDFYETFPVCFMISTDVRQAMLQLLFDELLTAVGPIVLRALATDDNEEVQQAWSAVMGPVRGSIVANRHVDAEWRRNLTVVEDEAYQGEIYDKLYEFIEGGDGTEARMTALIGELRAAPVAIQFAGYLERHFLGNIRRWATCYLREAYDLGEPIDFETSYTKIAALCDVCCRYAKPISYAAKGLLRLLLELQTARNRKVAENVIEINRAHDASAAHGIENVFPVATGAWKVNDTEGAAGMFEVRTASCTFDECVLTCSRCCACVHNFHCVCDSYVDGRTCVHVHLVGSMLTKTKSAGGEDDPDADSFRAFDRMADSLVDEAKMEELPERNADASEEASAAPTQSSELRAKKLETLKMLEDIGKKLLAEQSEKNVAGLRALVSEVRGNVDVLLSYGGHAASVTFAKNSKLKKVCKPAKKKLRATAARKAKNN